jgi:hypothetical protein
VSSYGAVLPPERPGALRFFEAIGARWNISLFHDRNYGSDYGRVLAGIQVPPGERREFLLHLNELHYAYVEETRNPAYSMSLGTRAHSVGAAAVLHEQAIGARTEMVHPSKNSPKRGPVLGSACS